MKITKDHAILMWQKGTHFLHCVGAHTLSIISRVLKSYSVKQMFMILSFGRTLRYSVLDETPLYTNVYVT